MNFLDLIASATIALSSHKDDVYATWRANDGGLTHGAGDEIQNTNQSLRELNRAENSADIHDIMSSYQLDY